MARAVTAHAAARPRPAAQGQQSPRSLGTPHSQNGTRVALGRSFSRPERTCVMLLETSHSAETLVDPKDAAESAGLRYVSDNRPGIRRKKAGTRFTYTRADGSKLSDKD